MPTTRGTSRPDTIKSAPDTSTRPPSGALGDRAHRGPDASCLQVSRALAGASIAQRVGSNPTPATTCENGPLAAYMHASGPFLLCPAVYHLVALWTGVLRRPRTYGGQRPCCECDRRA